MRRFFTQKGQSLVEIALITPLLLVALYIPFDFGMTIFAGHLTQNAARDGARIASRTRSLDNAAATGVADQVWAQTAEFVERPEQASNG